jgi:AcrR family transcriptional regulator
MDTSLRERNKQRVRGRILRVARRLFPHLGYGRTTMRRIADEARISHQTLYNYFPTKAQLSQAVLIEDVTELRSRIDACIDRYLQDAPGTSLLATLLEIHRIRLAVAEGSDRELWRVVSLDLLQRQPGGDNPFSLVEGEALRQLRGVIDVARRRGELRDDVDARTLAEIFFALGQHVLSRYLLDPRRDAADLLDSLQRQTRLLLSGLSPPCDPH